MATPTHLYAPPTSGDEGFYGGGVVAPSKFLLLSLPPWDDGNSQQILVHRHIVLQNQQHLHTQQESTDSELPGPWTSETRTTLYRGQSAF